MKYLETTLNRGIISGSYNVISKLFYLVMNNPQMDKLQMLKMLKQIQKDIGFLDCTDEDVNEQVTKIIERHLEK